eukprot:CAMPEP_0194131764 /NCGR_PEP_ID=MMETSP0152-20130528/2451_1 /TAXON_ID=1049557 /ORGANISM="Thalassiothrix antarctica, Strain L6-D1" /LENGTH=232 /DNA_ID=CAMNT_0038826639 /DNA_START=44 /DNA_END=742 /DNA_ORIENTATION=+
MLDGFRAQYGKPIMEFLGTMMLLFSIQTSVGLGAELAAVAIGVTLITIVYAGGPISGAHYNPAVSLAIFLRGKMTRSEMFMYWVFQILGGVSGAFLGQIIAGVASDIGVGAGRTLTQAFLSEVIFTFMLCFVVLGVATNSKADGNSYYGAAIGLVVMAGAITVGPVSGGAFNPAVALSLDIVKGFSNLTYAIEIVVADLLGGALAALGFWMVAPDQFGSIGATDGETTPLSA